MYRAGVIGDKDTILGFKAVGMSVHPAAGAKEAADVLDRLAREGYAVVFITDQLAKDMTHAIDKYRTERIPAIITIPGNKGSLGLGMARIKKAVEKAVGADILFKGGD